MTLAMQLLLSIVVLPSVAKRGSWESVLWRGVRRPLAPGGAPASDVVRFLGCHLSDVVRLSWSATKTPLRTPAANFWGRDLPFSSGVETRQVSLRNGSIGGLRWAVFV